MDTDEKPEELGSKDCPSLLSFSSFSVYLCSSVVPWSDKTGLAVGSWVG